jgi:erythromycin esterase-like protein
VQKPRPSWPPTYSNQPVDSKLASLAWLLRQEPAAKVVVWAHNIHIQHDKSCPLMGQYMAKQLGPAYVAIGFATGHGTASVFNSGGWEQALVLAPPLPESFEAWLDQAAPPNYFLPLNRLAVTDKWLAKSRKFRNIGFNVASSGANAQFMDYPPLSKAFDALFYLHETSASQPYQPAR